MTVQELRSTIGYMELRIAVLTGQRDAARANASMWESRYIRCRQMMLKYRQRWVTTRDNRDLWRFRATGTHNGRWRQWNKAAVRD